MADTPEVPETPPTPPPPPRKKWRRGVVILLLTIIAIPVLIFSLWVWVTLGYVYSTGERAGYVQKLSKKGWLCKTWEGELAMVPIPGTLTPQIFNFTVRSDSRPYRRPLNLSIVGSTGPCYFFSQVGPGVSARAFASGLNPVRGL